MATMIDPDYDTCLAEIADEYGVSMDALRIALKITRPACADEEILPPEIIIGCAKEATMMGV
ncbi:MAG: hypothetical protein PHP56_12855 [Smithellaceae bacterium]|nr:hypothetical protein [Smithellaceae bacterium]